MSSILGLNVQRTDYLEVVQKVLTWANSRESRSLVFANVHVIMETFDDRRFRDTLNTADIIAPDGVPLVWALKLLGNPLASRVYGPDCTLALIAAAEHHGIPIGFYGGAPAALERLQRVLAQRFPNVQIAAAISPAFRPLSEAENEAHVLALARSGARVIFIGLGCPKQEKWMMSNYQKIPAVMCAVGAAFDFIAGTKAQAPLWMMRSGTEWVFRLLTEPKRLYKRYLKQNPRFVFYFSRQILFRVSTSSSL